MEYLNINLIFFIFLSFLSLFFAFQFCFVNLLLLPGRTLLNPDATVCRTMMLVFLRCIDDYAFGVDLGPFFPGGHELWHHPLAYSAAAAAELPSAALQHATLVHPALHPQVPVRSYLWLNPEKMIDQPMQVSISRFFFQLDIISISCSIFFAPFS